MFLAVNPKLCEPKIPCSYANQIKIRNILYNVSKNCFHDWIDKIEKKKESKNEKEKYKKKSKRRLSSI